MVKDSAPEKWICREHTRVKHILLEKYLKAWVPILGKWNPKICYFDGFAGRGEYTDGTMGSPVKALRIADELAQYYGEIFLVSVERDKENFQNLEAVLEKEKPTTKNLKKIEIISINNEFANVVDVIFKNMEGTGNVLVPSFFFVDPFGFSGVPFHIVKRILLNPKTEIFFTLMVRDIGRFVAEPRLAGTLTNLFGTENWKDIIDQPNRELGLIELYRKQLHEEAGAKFSWPFRVCESDRLRTLHYLIHATNNFDGHSIMKSIMFKQGAEGSFAYLGPEDMIAKHQTKLFDINSIDQLRRFLLKKFAGESLTYEDIQEKACFPWYSEPPHIDRHYRETLKKLEEEGKIAVERNTSKTPRGLGGKDSIEFPKNNPMELHLPEVEPVLITKIFRKVQVHYKEYQLLDGTRRNMVWKVNDGSIIVRFDKTPVPTAKTDIVCPHFLELKWAYGCPFDCSWCYLKGTFRFQPTKTAPVIKPYDKTELHVLSFLEQVKTPEILNTGEIADSLMGESGDTPFSKFIIPLFEEQNLHKVLFLTKSDKVGHLLKLESHKQAIISFTLNALPVAESWEKAPSVIRRIKAAQELFDAGFEVRIRIDPMVPIENWQRHYLELLELIFRHVTPERITLGSLRGLQSTVNGCTDKTWLSYLKEPSSWGKRIDFETRHEMYQLLIHESVSSYKFRRISLCKETAQMWEALKGDYRKIKCNCVW